MVWYSHLLKNFPEFVLVHTLNAMALYNKPLMESSLLTGDQALSLWSGSIDSKTLDYHRINPREYQIVRTHTKETT